MKHSPDFGNSLLVNATDRQSPRRALTPVAGVVILSHAIRALNRMRATTLGELETRRESAALLQSIRAEIARDVAIGVSPVEF
jgi:hypothetical protein